VLLRRANGSDVANRVLSGNVELDARRLLAQQLLDHAARGGLLRVRRVHLAGQ
jgi:hypothetical protein